MRPYLLSIVIEDEWNGTKRQGDESNQTVAPAKSERIIHLQREERKYSAKDGTQDSIRGHG